MDNFEAIDLLETAHTFPGPYLFKAIGRTDSDFVVQVVTAVREELEESTDPPYRLQHTASGRHVSVSLEPIVESVYQVLAIYRRLSRTEGLVTLM